MLRILINNTFLNEICGRVLGGQSRIFRAIFLFLLVAAGVFLAGMLHFAAYLRVRRMNHPLIKTT